MEDNPRYTVIHHAERIALELTCNEYCVADSIHRLSGNKSKFQGWCYSSKEQLAEYLGLSKQSIHAIITTLIEKELVERDELTKWLRSTQKWYEIIEASGSKESLPTVKKVDPEQSRNFTPTVKKVYSDSKESLHNNNIYIKDSNKSTYGEFQKVKLTEDERLKLVERIGEKNADLLIGELDTYIASKNVKYSSHYATLLAWARKKYAELYKTKSNVAF